MLDALDHVIVAVEDLTAATRNYARLLGRSPSWRGEHPAMGTANTLFRVSNMYLELLSPEGEGNVADMLRGRMAEHGEGPAGLAFRTPDAAACHEAWTKAGLHPPEPSPGLGRDIESGAFREWTNVFLPPADTRGLLLFAIEHRTLEETLPEAPLMAEASACIGGLDHVVVQTRAPEAGIRLYGEQLGLRLGLDREFPKWGSRLIFFRVGGVTVELAAQLGEEGDSAATPDEDRLWGLSWRVSDADAAQARMAEAGLDVSEVRDGRKPGTKVFSVRGPTNGVPTLVKQPLSREESTLSDA
ncbi:MAG: hypothetical protein GY937_07625 [bacterium]|nr:hypothetical protein [bacterium]